MTSLFFWIGSWSFGAIRRFLMVVPPLKYTYTQCLLQTFFRFSFSPLYYGATMYGFWLLLMLEFVMFLLSLFWAGFLVLIFIVLRAHAGYLHFVSALYRWSSSCCSSWGFEQTVWTLWCRVPIMLQLLQYGAIFSGFNICHNDIMAITSAIILNRGYNILNGLTSTTTSLGNNSSLGISFAYTISWHKKLPLKLSKNMGSNTKLQDTHLLIHFYVYINC